MTDQKETICGRGVDVQRGRSSAATYIIAMLFVTDGGQPYLRLRLKVDIGDFAADGSSGRIVCVRALHSEGPDRAHLSMLRIAARVCFCRRPDTCLRRDRALAAKLDLRAIADNAGS